jgi:parallel beta-helix repeat protein
VALFAVLYALCPLSTVLAQGSLTPPGTPAPIFKTLQQIEPRIDLQNAPASAVDTTNAAYHFIINQPGSYYLSANLGVTKTNGIQINTEGVTLDLNGFEISRASGTGGNGIEIPATSHRASIRNGSLKGFAYGINSLGIWPRGCALRDLAATACTTAGIYAGQGAVLESCRAHDNSGSYGIFASNGSTLINCTASDNTVTYGIYAYTGATLLNCTAFNNHSAASTSAGIQTGAGCTISHCSARDNSSTATSTPTTGMGFYVGSANTIENCTATFNEGDGISISDSTLARANTCNNNGSSGDGAGIHATGGDNRIEGNNVTVNDRGIDVTAAGNLIIKNSAKANTLNYNIVANNHYGPIVNATNTPTAAVATNSAAAGTLGSPTSTDPWANFFY